METNHICKVLIVDDEILTRLGLRSLIHWEQEGFQIVGEASNGREALQQIEALQPHIVLTDIVMPVMDGEEFTRIAKIRYPEIEIIVLSSFGEFHYVRSTFQNGVADYILKPKLEAGALLSILKNTARKIPSLQLQEAPDQYKMSQKQLIENLIAGYQSDYDTASAAAAFPYEAYCLLGADLRCLTHKESSLEWIQSEVRSRLESELEQSVYERVPTETGTLVFLVNANINLLSQLKVMAESLAVWSEDQALDIAWMIGDVFSELGQLGEQYWNRFAKLSDYRYYLNDRRVLIYSELPNQTSSQLKFDMNQFTEELKREHFDEAFSYLKEYVSVMTDHYKTDVFEFKSFLSNIIFNVTIILANLGYDVKDLEEEKYSYFKKIDETKHAQAAVQLLESFLSEVDRRLANKPEAGNPNMKRLLDYIQDHYSEPLSLTGVAEHFHFNASYLSSYFVAHNKEGFSEYLNKIRVEKAVELLRLNAATISEISSMVGYSDHSYFTKVFKKLTGLSPSLYRKQFGTKDREWI